MPAPKLLRVGRVPTTTNSETLAGYVVPAGRAFIISAITIANRTTTDAPIVSVNLTGADAGLILNQYRLPVGETVEVGRGVVLQAGESPVVSTTTAFSIAVTMSGQEVDN